MPDRVKSDSAGMRQAEYEMQGLHSAANSAVPGKNSRGMNGGPFAERPGAASLGYRGFGNGAQQRWWRTGRL